jgi:collagenase-like PrtC family protease
LFECPFKLTHDAHIALANATPAANRTGELNRLFGCRRVVERDPWLVFKSPFIRPEDVDRYQYTADAIKICGRTLGPDFLIRAFDAYLDRRFEGNLLELFDSLDYLAERLEIPNTRLPADFYDRTAHCDKMCRACGWCRDLLDRTGRFVEPRLADFRPGGR